MNLNEDDYNFSNDDDTDFETNHERLKKFPLYVKAMEILETVDALSSSMSEKDKEIYSGILRESAMVIPPKIAGAYGSDNWLICMQNASIIRYHAEYLLSSTAGLISFTLTDKRYVKVLRTDLEEFKQLFITWVNSFEKLGRNNFEDQWAVFKRK
ncbi:MAG: hypothetical protein JWO32_2248 [Bacteroidetes bacterium]|nr:hypothetical protein [Bacteroidota bacterium]